MPAKSSLFIPAARAVRRLGSQSSLVVLAVLAVGCEPPPTLESTEFNETPYRDQWRTEHEGAFEAYDGEGNPVISDLQIGSALGSADNFINRGDVIVQFDGAPNTIKIEFRRFTSAATQSDAEANFEKVQLWAYNSSTGSPKKPGDMDEADRCGGRDVNGVANPWSDGCAILVYYTGYTQALRSGADIRVTLPADYHQNLGIETSDNVIQNSYPNRGNVCVAGLDGAVDIEMQSGVAFVSVASSTAYPSCTPALIEDCENFDDPSTPGPDAWSKDCGCIGQNYEPGRVRITSLEPASVDVVVDVHADLWTSFRAENAGENSLADKHCPSTVGGLGANGSIEYGDGGDDPNKPWLRTGMANRPSAAPAGGFQLDLMSNGCEPVDHVESPSDWDAENSDPESDLRGKIEICSGCLAAKRCDELLPGG